MGLVKFLCIGTILEPSTDKFRKLSVKLVLTEVWADIILGDGTGQFNFTA